MNLILQLNTLILLILSQNLPNLLQKYDDNILRSKNSIFLLKDYDGGLRKKHFVKAKLTLALT